MPPRQTPRPGLELLAQQGDEWETRKVAELVTTFGATTVLQPPGTARTQNLGTVLPRAAHGSFIVQAEFPLGPAFDGGLGGGINGTRGVGIGNLRPDLIEVCPAGTSLEAVGPDGETLRLDPSDERVQLRVIDIKLTSEPGPGYFAEVALYMVGIAGWLVDTGLESRFAVIVEGAVWPGTYEASALQRAVREQAASGVRDETALRVAFAEDLEPVAFEVFAFRLRRFFDVDIPRVLDAGANWRDLDWHVDNRCKGCDFLGDARGPSGPTPDAEHCLPLALSTDALSRVAFLSRGAGRSLRDQAVTTVHGLAGIPPTDARFDSHHALRTGRNVVSGRAESLITDAAAIPNAAGSSAMLPRFSNLRIYVSVDFDLGSALTIAFGISASWGSSQNWTPPASDPSNPGWKRWGLTVLIVDTKDPDRERDELIRFLDAIKAIIDETATLDPGATVQIYIWDELQFKHLARVIGRHLDDLLARPRPFAQLAWLFPPEDVVSNADLVLRQSHVTVVRDVVRSLLAAPIPHYYNLLDIARRYHPASTPANIATYSVHPLYEDRLSDQVPSERAHDIWARHPVAGMDWARAVATYRETVSKRLGALEAVTRALQDDANLRPFLLHEAPRVDIRSPATLAGVAVDSQLWNAFANLDSAMAALKQEQIRAMSPTEREARFAAAHLLRRLDGAERAAALATLGLPAVSTSWVYEMDPRSTDVKVRETDFNLVLSPRSDARFLDRKLTPVLDGHPIVATLAANERWLRMRWITKVSVAAIDRDARLIALDHDTWNSDLFGRLDAAGAIDVRNDVMLDGLHVDFTLDALARTLRRIGNPPNATRNPEVVRALNLRSRAPGTSPVTPVSEVLWEPARLAASATARDARAARSALEAEGVTLNPSQWAAFEAAMSHRMRLLWGPPGTGKSRTIRTIVAGSLVDAERRVVPQRILITGPTYNALDEVLTDVIPLVGSVVTAPVAFHRLRSSANANPPPVPATDTLRDRYAALRARLVANDALTVVAATTHQVNRLLTSGGGTEVALLFDLILVDEASQVDVAHGVFALAALANDGTLVVGGDPKQMAPIHQAEPPRKLETLVGSLYEYFAGRYAVPASELLENYRSNRVIVEFEAAAGYPPALRAVSPDLRLGFATPVPTAEPPSWPTRIAFSSRDTDILEPDTPTVCFTYDEGRSVQSNEFEAERIAALALLLRPRLRDRLDGDGGAPSTTTYDDEGFWQRGLGIVTPHKAQQAMIISKLSEAFSANPAQARLIRNAVDTVERFQGQQRDVMLASYAMGDPDAIGDEEEFLLSLNRFNVMASRARAKLIVFVATEVVAHMAREIETIRDSRLIKQYAESFCNERQAIMLPAHRSDGTMRDVAGVLAVHRF